MKYTHIVKNDEIFRQCIDVVIEGGRVLGFIAYVFYFDPMGERRKPKRTDPFLFTQLQLDQARKQALRSYWGSSNE